MGKVVYTRRAREDLLDIWAYIAPRSSQTVADRVYDRIGEACRLLAQHPQLGRARPEIAADARALVIDRWLALYRLVPGGVEVARIMDGGRDLSKIDWPFE